MSTSKVLLGRILVDSGQVMVGDPAYLHGWEDDEFDPEKVKTKELSDAISNCEKVVLPYCYSGACVATLSPEMGGQLAEGLSVACASGYGDGTYPVYAVIENGRVKRLVVEFF